MSFSKLSLALLDGEPKLIHRPVDIPKLVERKAEVAMGFRIIAIVSGKCLPERIDRLLQLPLTVVDKSEVVIGIRVGIALLNRRLIVASRRLQRSLAGKSVAEIAVRIGEVGLLLDGKA